MRKQKAVTGFARHTDNDLVAVAQNIVNKMPSDPDFPDPTPPISSVAESLKDFSTALEKSYGGTKKDTAYKNEKRKELISKLSRLGEYVNLASNEDLVKIEGSGFPLTKPPAPVGILPAPKYVRVRDNDDNNGELTIEISHVPRASGYLVLYSEAPAPENLYDWHSKVMSKSKGILTGLKSATKYIFKAAAISPEASKLNRYNYTQSVERIIQ